MILIVVDNDDWQRGPQNVNQEATSARFISTYEQLMLIYKVAKG